MQNHHPDCNQPMADASMVACLDCDLLQRILEVPAGASVRCVRCNKELWRHKTDSLNRTFALTLAALVLYLIANTVPMLGLHAAGRQASPHRRWRRASTLAGRPGDRLGAGVVRRRDFAGASDCVPAVNRARLPV
ncbi:MAG: hypothetical protein WDM80_05965 [Limisphaerales bacterium]